MCYPECTIVFIRQKTAYEMRISDWSSDVCSSDLPTPPSAPPALPAPGAIARSPVESAPSTITPAPRPGHAAAAPTRREDDMAPREASAASPTAGVGDLLQEHIISPAPTTERLQSIQRMVADQLGDALPPDFSANVLQRSEEHTSELQ